MASDGPTTAPAPHRPTRLLVTSIAARSLIWVYSRHWQQASLLGKRFLRSQARVGDQGVGYSSQLKGKCFPLFFLLSPGRVILSAVRITLFFCPLCVFLIEQEETEETEKSLPPVSSVSSCSNYSPHNLQSPQLAGPGSSQEDSCQALPESRRFLLHPVTFRLIHSALLSMIGVPVAAADRLVRRRADRNFIEGTACEPPDCRFVCRPERFTLAGICRGIVRRHDFHCKDHLHFAGNESAGAGAGIL